MFKIKTKDKVIVLTGKNKNKISTVKKIINKKYKNTYKRYAILDTINTAKKHVKANPAKNKDGGIIHIEVPIAISNIMPVNSKTNKKDKIKFLYTEGKKYRYFKSNKELII